MCSTIFLHSTDSPVGRAESVKTVEMVEHGALPFRRTAKSCAAVYSCVGVKV
jgi:hypothetical protein